MIKMLSSFFLALFFDHQDEYNFNSAKFNIRKVLVMVVFSVSVGINFFLIVNYFELAGKYLELKETYTSLTKQLAEHSTE